MSKEELEKAYEAWCEREGNLRTDFERDAFIAGFQARSHLVELLRDCRHAIEALKTTQKDTGLGPLGELIAEELLARIDAALKGEK